MPSRREFLKQSVGVVAGIALSPMAFAQPASTGLFLSLAPMRKMDVGLDIVWKPVGSDQPGSGFVDLSRPGVTPDWALLGTPTPPSDPEILHLGYLGDPVSAITRQRMTSVYPHAIGAMTIQSMLGQVVRQPRAGMLPLRPLRSGLHEIWLAGSQVWTDAAAGTVGLRGMSELPDELVALADFSSRSKFRQWWMDWFGYLPLVALGILASWDHPEWWPFLGALPATDALTNTNGTALTTHSANWSYAIGSFYIQSNGATPNSGSNSIAYWNAETFNNDQYAVITYLQSGTGLGTYAGPSCRGSGSPATGSGYFGFAHDADNRIRKSVSGTVTALDDEYTVTWVDTDLFRMETEGSTIRWTHNGTNIKSPWTDTSITSGKAGLGGFGSDTANWSIADSVEMGNLSTGRRPIAPLIMGKL